MAPAQPGPQAKDLRFTAGDLARLGRVWTTVTLASLAISMSIPLMLDLDPKPSVAITARVVALGALVLFLLWARQPESELGFAGMWRFICMALCAAYTTVQIRGAGQIAVGLVFAAWDLVVPMAWLTFADIARYSDVPRRCTLGLFGGVYLLASAIGGALGVRLSGALGVGQLSAILAFGMTLLLGICLTRSDLLTSRIFEDMRPIPQRDDDRVMHSRCDSLAAKFCLTDRERQIITMIASGKSHAFIAEALMISENTVKSHTSHAYAKMGVHGKKELYALVNEGQTR